MLRTTRRGGRHSAAPSGWLSLPVWLVVLGWVTLVQLMHVLQATPTQAVAVRLVWTCAMAALVAHRARTDLRFAVFVVATLMLGAADLVFTVVPGAATGSALGAWLVGSGLVMLSVVAVAWGLYRMVLRYQRLDRRARWELGVGFLVCLLTVMPAAMASTLAGQGPLTQEPVLGTTVVITMCVATMGAYLAFVTPRRLHAARLVSFSCILVVLIMMTHIGLVRGLPEQVSAGWLWAGVAGALGAASRLSLPVNSAGVPDPVAPVPLGVRLTAVIGVSLVAPLATLVPLLPVGWAGLAVFDRMHQGYAVVSVVVVALILTYVSIMATQHAATAERLTATLTEKEALRRDLEHRAHHDRITGLPNRFAFTELVQRLTRPVPADQDHHGPGPAAHAVMFIDLDEFKAVNDTLGHAAGDHLLQVVADRLSAATRVGDTVARLGGDEFAIVLPHTSTAVAAETGRRIIEIVSTPVDFTERQVRVGASIGVAPLCPGDDWGARVADADIAMYAAKQAGKGQVLVFDPTLRRKVDDEADLASTLEGALADGQIRLHYQPIMALSGPGARGTGVHGFEALLRWHHPQRGAVPPDVFVGVAERHGLMADLDMFVLGTALEAVGDLCEVAGPDLRMSVNVSAGTLARPDLPQAVAQALARAGQPSARLTIEVTERSALQEVGTVTASLGRLRESGVHVALDDFGTGYSSLSWLQDLPIDVVKLDKTFLSRSGDDGDPGEVVRAVIALSHSLQLAVVAEGVETAPVAAALREAGCEYGQGWLYAAAMPLDEARDWLQARLPGPGPTVPTDTTPADTTPADAADADGSTALSGAGAGPGTDTDADALRTLPLPLTDLLQVPAWEDLPGHDADTSDSPPPLPPTPLPSVPLPRSAPDDHAPRGTGTTDGTRPADGTGSTSPAGTASGSPGPVSPDVVSPGA